MTIHLGGNIVPSINPLFNTISHVRLWLSESVVRNGITNNPYTAAPLKPYSIVRKGVHLNIYCGNLLSYCRSPPVVDYLLQLWIIWHPLPVVDYLAPNVGHKPTTLRLYLALTWRLLALTGALFGALLGAYWSFIWRFTWRFSSVAL